MDTYVGPSGGSADFKLLDTHGQQLAKVHATRSNDALASPAHVEQDGARSEYPYFIPYTSDGVTEVIEHKRMEPVFYVNDEPAVRMKLGVPKS